MCVSECCFVSGMKWSVISDQWSVTFCFTWHGCFLVAGAWRLTLPRRACSRTSQSCMEMGDFAASMNGRVPLDFVSHWSLVSLEIRILESLKSLKERHQTCYQSTITFTQRTTFQLFGSPPCSLGVFEHAWVRWQNSCRCLLCLRRAICEDMPKCGPDDDIAFTLSIFCAGFSCKPWPQNLLLAACNDFCSLVMVRSMVLVWTHHLEFRTRLSESSQTLNFESKQS